MIFQEPMTSLNPVYTIGKQLTEAIRLHQEVKPSVARTRAMEMLEAVGVSSPAQRLREYPHELSGGMRQRVMIAMALSCHPSLLIADEPTTALDVTIQAQVLALMRRLKEVFEASILFITHDLGVIAQMADEVAVMYLGRIVERAPVAEIFGSPAHPYTLGLLSSTPSILRPRSERLRPIKGTVPSAADSPHGCAFADRCPVVMDVCRGKAPPVSRIAAGHEVRCWHHANAREGQ
jgi:oligopeptide/dipeptide ABC transporter ATP-binding protein